VRLGLAGHGRDRLGKAGQGRVFSLSSHPVKKGRLVFTPKGERAEWRVIYDEARKLAPGDVLSYGRLSQVLGRDVRSGRVPVERVIRELQQADSRTLVCVRGQGYRIAAATEHEHLARRHSARSRRQLAKAAAAARSANRAELSPEQARRLDELEMQFSQHAGMLRRLDARDRQREAEIRQLRRDTSGGLATLSGQVSRLADVLQRHGIDPGTPSPGTPSPGTAMVGAR